MGVYILNDIINNEDNEGKRRSREKIESSDNEVNNEEIPFSK